MLKKSRLRLPPFKGQTQAVLIQILSCTSLLLLATTKAECRRVATHMSYISGEVLQYSSSQAVRRSKRWGWEWREGGRKPRIGQEALQNQTPAASGGMGEKGPEPPVATIYRESPFLVLQLLPPGTGRHYSHLKSFTLKTGSLFQFSVVPQLFFLTQNKTQSLFKNVLPHPTSPTTELQCRRLSKHMRKVGRPSHVASILRTMFFNPWEQEISPQTV